MIVNVGRLDYTHFSYKGLILYSKRKLIDVDV